MTKHVARSYRSLERIVKGFANHRRLEIIDLLAKEPELTVADISERLKIGYVNTADHLNKMAIAGLVLKRGDGPYVRHKLTSRAEVILAFCRKLE